MYRNITKCKIKSPYWVTTVTTLRKWSDYQRSNVVTLLKKQRLPPGYHRLPHFPFFALF